MAAPELSSIEQWVRHCVRHKDGEWNADAMWHILLKLEELHAPLIHRTHVPDIVLYRTVVEIGVCFLQRFPDTTSACELRTRVSHDLERAKQNVNRYGTNE